MKINPPYSRFIIFSGGGGLALREQTVRLSAGRNIVELQDLPSSFDEDTVAIELEETEAELVQVVVKKPDRKFVEDAMKRERDASVRILSQAVDVRAELRDELLNICEGIRSYRYEDSFSELLITIDSNKEENAKIKISYFMDDPRFWWSPSIQIDISEDEKEARITGYILIENQTSLNFGDVEVKCVEFEGVGRRPLPPSPGPESPVGPPRPPGPPPPRGYPSPPAAAAPSAQPRPGKAQLRKEMLGELRKIKSIF